MPGTVRLFVPGRYGGVELGDLPALPIAVIDTLMGLTAVAWIIFVIRAWPQCRLAQALIPITAYIVGTGSLVGLIIAQDPSDAERILTAMFVAVMFGLLVTLFAAGFAAKPNARRRS